MAGLADLGRFPNPIAPSVSALYDAVHHTRVRDLAGYKELCYQLVDDETFRQL